MFALLYYVYSVPIRLHSLTGTIDSNYKVGNQCDKKLFQCVYPRCAYIMSIANLSYVSFPTNNLLTLIFYGILWSARLKYKMLQ